MEPENAAIEVENLECRYGERLVLRDVEFEVQKEEVFVVMGPSGCGKSTLLKNLVGLEQPVRGDIRFFGRSFLEARQAGRNDMLREIGILYQSGALWSAMTVGENVALPLREYTTLPEPDIRRLVTLKLGLVGLAGFEDRAPGELSGGQRKRAGLARALALDPALLFFDEPSAGLDPLTSRNLDELILKIRDSLGTTVLVVSHELDSIHTIADRVMMLDVNTRTTAAIGPPADLLESGPAPVREFLTRGGDLRFRSNQSGKVPKMEI